jgi:hypothetical protein
MGILDKMKDRLPGKEVREELKYTTRFIGEKNSVGKKLVGDSSVYLPLLILAAVGVGGVVYYLYRRNEAYNYALGKGLTESEAEIFRPLSNDLNLSEDEKVLIDSYAKLPKEIRNVVQDRLRQITSDGIVRVEELAGFLDLDNDGIANTTLVVNKESKLARLLIEKGVVYKQRNGDVEFIGETDLKSNPLLANPNLYQAVKNGWDSKAQQAVIKLDSDGRQDGNERQFMEALDFLFSIPNINKEALVRKIEADAADGTISPEEVKGLGSYDGNLFSNNPVLKYAFVDLKLPRNGDLVRILLPLEQDGRMDESDKKFVDWIKNYGDNWAKLKGILYHVAKDGSVSEDEMKLTDTVSVIPVLIPDFKALERIPERVYQGRDLSGWETVLSDHPWVHPKEEPASIEDVDAIHHGDYSEVRSNVRLRSIYVLNGTFFKIFDDKIFEFIHISGHYFRIPYPTRDLKVKINSEVIGGGFQTFDGPSATGYEIGWGWILNPWNTDHYTRVGFWTWTPEGTKQPWTESKEPDTDWHKIIYIFDKKNDNGYILVDDMVHKVDKIPTKYVPEWQGSGRSANLVVEVYNPWPGTPTSEVRDDPELCYRAMGIVQVKDWFWLWEPYEGS